MPKIQHLLLNDERLAETLAFAERLRALQVEADGAQDVAHAYEQPGHLYFNLKKCVTDLLTYAFGPEWAQKIYEASIDSGESLQHTIDYFEQRGE